MKAYNLRGIPDDVWREIHKAAIDRGLTIRAAVVEALQEWLRAQQRRMTVTHPKDGQG